MDGDLCPILQQRWQPWHLQAQQASDDMLHDSQAVTEVDWTGTFMLSRGGEPLLSYKVTLCQMKTDDKLSGHPV